MAAKKKYVCTLEYALDIIAGKWKVFIIWLLKDEIKRYGQIKSSMPKTITHKVLSSELNNLEADGFINRYQYNEIPPKVEYSLTQKGKELIPVLYSLREWGEKFKPEE